MSYECFFKKKGCVGDAVEELVLFDEFPWELNSAIKLGFVKCRTLQESKLKQLSQNLWQAGNC